MLPAVLRSSSCFLGHSFFSAWTLWTPPLSVARVHPASPTFLPDGRRSGLSSSLPRFFVPVGLFFQGQCYPIPFFFLFRPTLSPPLRPPFIYVGSLAANSSSCLYFFSLFRCCRCGYVYVDGPMPNISPPVGRLCRRLTVSGFDPSSGPS